jgi:hypothetical protein
MALGTYRPRNASGLPLVCSHCKTGHWFATTKAASDAGWGIAWDKTGKRPVIVAVTCPECNLRQWGLQP